MAQWVSGLARRNCNPEVPGSSPALGPPAGRPEFNSSAVPVNNPLRVGIFSRVSLSRGSDDHVEMAVLSCLQFEDVNEPQRTKL